MSCPYAFNVLLPWGGFNGISGFVVMNHNSQNKGTKTDIIIWLTSGIQLTMAQFESSVPLQKKENPLYHIIKMMQEFQLRTDPKVSDVLDLRNENFHKRI